MTVCVAAMCDWHTIIGASDRMLTAGDIQFEPQQPKIIPLTSAIAVMIAGDSSMQAEIIQNIRKDINMRIEADPENWWEVKDVAQLYRSYYNKAKFLRAQNRLLAPLGLDGESFIGKQNEMNPDFVRKLATELINYEPPLIEAIITGSDKDGGHIYVANNDDITCRDTVGFAAIGVGAWHANSQLMFSGHTRTKSFPETLLIVYSAKKRAEVAPGVGEATDMFVIGPRYLEVGDHVLDRLKRIYQDAQKREQKAASRARESVKQYVEEISSAETPAEQAKAPPDSGGNSSTDKKDL